MENFEAPVREGETHTVKIQDVGKEGDGIARIDGFVVFVSGARIGEEVDIRINRVLKRFAFGEKI
ncbi:MAG: TRAM domain-containing protein [Candidatus Hydrothermarchaeales archaeon]